MSFNLGQSSCVGLVFFLRRHKRPSLSFDLRVKEGNSVAQYWFEILQIQLFCFPCRMLCMAAICCYFSLNCEVFVGRDEF